MSQLPNNPNATSNRVPEGTELASLRTMASHKQRVVDHLIQEARVARGTYDEVKRRYEVQYLALQATQSELHVANELAESLEKTVASLQSDLGQLRGLLHPLRHCPDEVLGLIFEEARKDFDDAVTISHVCRRWRAIAISSPLLWSRIDLALDLPDNAAESKVQAFLSRIKHVPATIYLSLWSDETVVNERLRTKVRIVGKTLQASRVDYLVISIDETFEHSSILGALPTFPRHRLTSLDMTDNTVHSESQGTWTDFLSRFGSIRKFHLTCGSFGSRITRDLQSTMKGTLEVTLDVVDELPLTRLLQIMPNIQHFEGTDCVPLLDLEDTTTRVALPNLRSLCIYEMAVPWGKIDCPLITKISLRDIGTLDLPSFWEFLPSARMLTEIRLNPSPSQLSNLARVAPQIQDLYITGIREADGISVLVDWERFGLDGPAFPNLRLLHLDPRGSRGSIDFEALDSLIHGRCLLSEDGVGATTTLDELVILSSATKPFWNHNHSIANHFEESRKIGVVTYRFVGRSKPQT